MKMSFSLAFRFFLHNNNVDKIILTINFLNVEANSLVNQLAMKRIVTFLLSFICFFYVNDCAIHNDEVCEAHLAYFEKSLDFNEEWALQSKLIDTIVSQNDFFPI